MIFLALLTLMISKSSLAASCPGANVRMDQVGGSMEFVKPRNQAPLQTCYAFAAAEVWDAYRFSHYPPEVLAREKGFYTIPMQAALALQLQNGLIARESDWSGVGSLPIEKGGDPLQALQYYTKNKTCVSSATTDELFADLPGRTRTEKAAYLQTIINDGEEARKLLASYRIRAKGQDAKTLASLQAQYDKELQLIVKNTKLGAGDACFKKGALDTFLDEYIKSAQFSENSLLNIQNALVNSCEKKSMPVDVKKAPTLQSGIGVGEKIGTGTATNNLMRDTKAQASLAIQSALSGKFSQPTQPILLSMCSNFLKLGKSTDGSKRNQAGILDPARMRTEIASGHCTPHSVVAIGRKTVGNECKILIRNSGELCKNNTYSKDWTCDEHGDDVWVDADTVMNNTLSYSFFKD